MAKNELMHEALLFIQTANKNLFLCKMSLNLIDNSSFKLY